MSGQSAHLGFARKYRPQNFEEIVGQEAVSTTLKNSLTADKPFHAYLFFGPRGVGKTTCARILAKALNCQKGTSPRPCGACASCVEIARSASVDVLELDAATHTQVDRIREMIIETVSLTPSRDRYKIFIIDEVHMLSTASFNALLKTLEEPPAHVVFVLATTDPGKIPPTIVSRCQRFRFRPVAPDVIEAHLGRIAKEENIRIEPEALPLLAQAAGGALRDAVSLLEQAHAYAGGTVAAKIVRDLLGVLPEELLESFGKAILARDARALSQLLEKVWEEGYDASQLLRDLRERVRAAYLYRLGVAAAIAPGWKSLAEPHSADTFSFLIQRLNRALESLRGAESGRLALELALFGLIESAYDLREWIQRLEALESRLGSASGGGPAPSVAAEPRSPSPEAEEEEAPMSAAKGSRESRAPASSGAQVWEEVLKQLEEDRPGLANDLRMARLSAPESGPWRLLFGRAFDADRARRHEKEIESKLASTRGAPVQILFEVQAGEVNSDTDASERSSAGPAGAKEGPADPAVEKVLQVFSGKVRIKKK